MKAEQRKELKTNALADKVGGMFKGAKSYAGAVWALLIIGVVVYFFYWWYSGNYADRIALAWVDFLNATEWHPLKENVDKRLEEMGKSRLDDEALKQATAELQFEHFQQTADLRKGTTAEKPIRLRMADAQYRYGFGQLDNIPGERGAKKWFDEAKTGYEEIAKNPGDCKEVGLRALTAVAKCQEGSGEIDEAKATYQKVLDLYSKQFRAPDGGPAHPLIVDAEQSLAFLESDMGKRLYRDWTTRHRITSPVEKVPEKPGVSTKPTTEPPPEK